MKKKYLPPQLVNTRALPVNSSLFAFGEKSMLCSYIPKKCRNVILISSMDDSDDIDETSSANKPTLLVYYNQTKGSVDVVDRLKSDYSVARISSRWPVRVFFTMLDVGILNSQIIFKLNTNTSMHRKTFQKTLALNLTRNHMITRAANVCNTQRLKQEIRLFLGMPAVDVPDAHPSDPASKKKCGYCPSRKNGFTQHHCVDCQVPVCGEHTATRMFRCHQCLRGGEDVDSM